MTDFCEKVETKDPDYNREKENSCQLNVTVATARLALWIIIINCRFDLSRHNFKTRH